MADEPALERIRKLVHTLASAHHENVWTGETIRALDRLPLLTDLRNSIHSNVGRGTGASDAHTRSLLNLTVFEMYEDITGRIDAFYKALTGKPPRDTAEETLNAWYVAYRAFSMSGHYSETQERRVEDQLKKFVARIVTYFDPPRVKELEGECPMDKCGLSRTKTREGAAQTALYAAYKPGERPTVGCRACGMEWAGDRALLELGYYLKANVDEETLRAMGVLA